MNKKTVIMLATAAAAAMMSMTAFAEEADLSGEIRVASWNNAGKSLETIAGKFMEEHPEATIVVDFVDAEYTKLYPALASGMDIPDVIQTQQTDIQAFLNNYPGSFMDVTDIVEPAADQFAPAALGVSMGSDGKYYAVPWDIGPCGFMYRTDVFEEADVDATAIKTWDDFYEAGVKINEATGKKVLGFCYNGASSADAVKLLLHQQGGRYYNEEGKVDFLTDEMLNAFSFLAKCKDADITVDLPSEWDDRIAALNNEELVALPYAAWYCGTMMESVAEQAGKWAILPMPSFDGETMQDVSLGGSILAVSETTEYPELAKAFVEYALMGPVGNEIDFGTYGQFSSYKPAYDCDAYKVADDYFGIARGEFFSAHTNGPAIDFGPYFTDVDQSLRTAIGEVFVNGADPTEALTAAQEAAQRLIDAK